MSLSRNAMPRSSGSSKPWGGVAVDQTPSRAMLRPDPYENVIVGAQNILRYVGMTSMSTLWRWTENFGFPAIKRPDGLWMTTMTAIDQWIFLAAEISNENLERSRGLSAEEQLILRRLERQIKSGDYPKIKRKAAIKCAKGVGLIPKSEREGKNRE
jgi:hypothetical protein